MPYQVLARKWRPKSFAQMVGQETTVRTLSNALEQDRLHHAYLFTGTRGVGKTTIARIIAKCLNCEKGISANPCGECATCVAIDNGQFVDLLEVDAASRTKVEDTRELLDNVQYAPTQGRFKIYLIDEVHMLSGHSFNALLKTLEEPPPHVKFLLATTDPQKLPITVLSRCLQFHLKGMAPDIIAAHLKHILNAEKINFTESALTPLAEAANGSMRDALSLLDQAIAFSDANINDDTVRELLGTTSQADLIPLLEALTNQDGAALLAHIDNLALQGVNFTQVLADLLSLLHNISVLQVLPDVGDSTLQIYADNLSKEDVQLCYQIGLIGQRDLPYAPSLRSGFEMVLLRMLAFKPDSNAQSAPSAPAKKTSPATVKKEVQKKEAAPKISASNNWAELVAQLNIGGMTKVLAQNAVLDKTDDGHFYFHIEPKHSSIANDKQQQQLQRALSEHFGKNIKCHFEFCEVSAESPAQQKQRIADENLNDAKNNLIDDPHVQSILQDFGGSLDEKSIKSLKN